MQKWNILSALVFAPGTYGFKAILTAQSMKLDILCASPHVYIEFDTNLRFIEKSGALAGQISTSSTCAELS